jgi:hypothetical protein
VLASAHKAYASSDPVSKAAREMSRRLRLDEAADDSRRRRALVTFLIKPGVIMKVLREAAQLAGSVVLWPTKDFTHKHQPQRK